MMPLQYSLFDPAKKNCNLILGAPRDDTIESILTDTG